MRRATESSSSFWWIARVNDEQGIGVGHRVSRNPAAGLYLSEDHAASARNERLTARIRRLSRAP
jgi:hypothetical protein